MKFQSPGETQNFIHRSTAVQFKKKANAQENLTNNRKKNHIYIIKSHGIAVHSGRCFSEFGIAFTVFSGDYVWNKICRIYDTFMIDTLFLLFSYMSGGMLAWLSGMRCRLAYRPADATATHYLLLQ